MKNQPRPGRRIVQTGVLQLTVFFKGQMFSAEILLDGKRVGMTPLSLREVPAGRHRIQARAPGYRPRTRTITVKAQRINSFVITLKPEG